MCDCTKHYNFNINGTLNSVSRCTVVKMIEYLCNNYAYGPSTILDSCNIFGVLQGEKNAVIITTGQNNSLVMHIHSYMKSLNALYIRYMTDLKFRGLNQEVFIYVWREVSMFAVTALTLPPTMTLYKTISQQGL